MAKIHLIQLLPFLLALFWALNAFGLVGAAIVYLARNTIDTIMLQAASGERLQHHPELPLTFAALLVLALAGVRLSLSEPIQLLVWTALAGIVSLALSWRTAPPGLKGSLSAPGRFADTNASKRIPHVCDTFCGEGSGGSNSCFADPPDARLKRERSPQPTSSAYGPFLECRIRGLSVSVGQSIRLLD